MRENSSSTFCCQKQGRKYSAPKDAFPTELTRRRILRDSLRGLNRFSGRRKCIAITTATSSFSRKLSRETDARDPLVLLGRLKDFREPSAQPRIPLRQQIELCGVVG